MFTGSAGGSKSEGLETSVSPPPPPQPAKSKAPIIASHQRPNPLPVFRPIVVVFICYSLRCYETCRYRRPVEGVFREELQSVCKKVLHDCRRKGQAEAEVSKLVIRALSRFGFTGLFSIGRYWARSILRVSSLRSEVMMAAGISRPRWRRTP